MSTVRGSAHSKSYAGLLPVALSDEFVRPADRKNDRFLNQKPSLRKRALHTLAHFLITFCIFLAAILAWRSYGDAARQVIANSYPQLGWLAPPDALTAQKAPDTTALAAPGAPYRDRQHFDAMLRDIQSMRQSIDLIAAGQEQIADSIDQIATTIAAAQEQMTFSTDQTATSIAAGKEPTTRSTNQTAAAIATGQEQMTRNTDQTATEIDQSPSKPTSIPIESRGHHVLVRRRTTQGKRPST